MSAKRPELTPELLKRILPALRMMVRFPARAAKVISFETSIELADIYAYTEVRGRPKLKDLQEIERQLDDPCVPDGVEAPLPPAKLTAVPAIANGTAPAPARNGKMLRAGVLAKMRPVLERLGRGNPAYRIAAEFDVRFSNLCSFCRTWFKDRTLAQLTPDEVAEFLAWADAELAARGEPDAPPPPLNGTGPDSQLSALNSQLSGIGGTQPVPLPHHPPEVPRHSARNAVLDLEVALTGLRDKYVAELDALEKTLAGVERAILCAKARIEVAEEAVALAKGAA